mmetsp:Transcript_18895/g.52029  ORF Transcript_18895/g.52029 Transcript_18895/m.52029 type:complete len:268 (-) Transcript_18895:323-1126(-)
MSGCSMSRLPKALRPQACCAACCAQRRMSAALPMTQSRRVCTTMSTMVRTPRPGGPSITPHASRYSTSLEALDLSPSLSLSRCTVKPLFREPSGSQRGTMKQETPSLVCARVRKASHIGAEVNHLCPSNQKPSPGPSCPGVAGLARVVLARTSEPPCFSVMDIPTVAPGLCCRGASAPLYRRATSLASSPATKPPRSCSGRCCRSAGTAAKLIVTGQETPGSSWYMRCTSAPRATCAPGRPACSGAQAKAAAPASRPSCMSWWYAGW